MMTCRELVGFTISRLLAAWAENIGSLSASQVRIVLEIASVISQTVSVGSLCRPFSKACFGSSVMRLHCLGTVGYHANSTRQTSCYFLPESGIVLDAGSGIFRLPELIQTDSLDILLSHAHLDHTLGLTFLLDVLYERPVEQLRIWGEADKIAAIREHLFSELIFPAELDAQWMTIDDSSEFQIGEINVAWRRQQHPGGSVAYRLDWPGGERLVYATDTTGDTSDQHAEWSSNANLLMHECYFRDQASEWAEKTGHSWTGRVIEVATAAKPNKLLLTHINPLESSDDPVDLDLIRSKVDCEVVLAMDEMMIDF
jgi:ribonuclease Z